VNTISTVALENPNLNHSTVNMHADSIDTGNIMHWQTQRKTLLHRANIVTMWTNEHGVQTALYIDMNAKPDLQTIWTGNKFDLLITQLKQHLPDNMDIENTGSLANPKGNLITHSE
jgi:hypothetical protein